MSESKTSQAQQNPWREAAQGQVGRMEAFYEQLARYEIENAERARQSIDEMARLTKEAIEQGSRLAAEWRRLSIEAMQRSAELASRSL